MVCHGEVLPEIADAIRVCASIIEHPGRDMLDQRCHRLDISGLACRAGLVVNRRLFGEAPTFGYLGLRRNILDQGRREAFFDKQVEGGSRSC